MHLECILKMFRYFSHKMLPFIPLFLRLIPTTEGWNKRRNMLHIVHLPCFDTADLRY